ncbi:MAG: stage II sporulation protein P [Natronincolaceae bacterium]|jgi:stage II sporulation protein P|nr:stage II sporulation protein P [Bacillota bacterium]NLK91105.1 stage II sporulation protein P [Clostridiales bacterium]
MKKSRLVCMLLLLITLTTQFVIADDWYGEKGGYYKVYDMDSNEILFQTAREVVKDDQYLSGDNKMYRIVKANKRDQIAYAQFVEDVLLPEIDEEIFSKIGLMLQNGASIDSILAQTGQNDKSKRKVGIYSTHSSESYIPSDGAEASESKGGILKVAEKLKQGFEKNGVDATFDSTLHNPHDAGAYKRSRRTALQLIRKQHPTALIDVHRDAVPAEEYLTEVEGKPAAKVRLVIGRRNQNFKANEDMAKKVKSVADKMYPNFVKDIFFGQGDYNQDLMPRAMLTELGTYKHTRERSEKSAGFLSKVITVALFGDVFKDSKGTATAGGGTTKGTKPGKPVSKSGKGAGAGILGILALAVIGGVGFLFLSSGSTEWKSKMSNFRQEFANFLGRNKNRK